MTATARLGTWLQQSARLLGGLSDQPALEVQVLAAAVLETPRSRLLAHPETILSEDQKNILEEKLARRLKGEPLPYLTGKQEFYGLEFIVSPAVLIPRPETELLVEEALGWLKEHPTRRRAADCGTGSGCIAVSLAKNCPGLVVFGGDISRPALRVARANILRQQVAGQVLLYQGSLLEGTAPRLDLLCANLPYIPSARAAGLEVARHEPFLALDGGADGLELIRRLLEQSVSRLAPGGLILLEIEAGMGSAALAAARECYPKAGCLVLADLAGLERILKIVTIKS